MRPGLKTLLAALLVAALVVPAATAQPGNGNGGGGKPSTAGPPSDRGGGKPSWAGQGQAKRAEQAAAKDEKAAARAAAKAERAQAKAERAEARSAAAAARTSGKPDLTNLDELTAEDLAGLNPAWTCKVEHALTGDSFAGDFGTNENDANAFGMCVSEEAQERDGVSEEAVTAFCAEDSEAALCAEDTGAATTETETEGESLADLLGSVTLDDSEDEGSGEGDAAGEDDEGSDEPDSILAMLRSLF
jgi:hypothetical protein